jgi:hypothetical protein
MNLANEKLQQHQQETVTPKTLYGHSAIGIWKMSNWSNNTIECRAIFQALELLFCFHLHKRWKEWWCWCWWRKESMDLPIDQSESTPTGAPSTGCL